MCVPTSALPKQCLYANEDINHVVIVLYPNVISKKRHFFHQKPKTKIKHQIIL